MTDVNKQYSALNMNLHNTIDITKLEQENQELRNQIAELLPHKCNFFAPGHFYSPIPNFAAVWQNEDRIWDYEREIKDVNLNIEHQLDMVKTLGKYAENMPVFPDHKSSDFRYYSKNSQFSLGDAVTLHSMMRYLKPNKIIEIGSGYSSCMMLDTNKLYFNNSIDCTFIEPYPERLLGALEDNEKQNINLQKTFIQDVPLNIFSELEGNDILFIDCSHVSKIDSDLNHILFNILPVLKKGVYIHIHDVFYPFEYPKEWIKEERAWNECYLLRAFLQNNDAYSIEVFTSYLIIHHYELLRQLLPDVANRSGGHIWLKKTRESNK